MPRARHTPTVTDDGSLRSFLRLLTLRAAAGLLVGLLVGLGAWALDRYLALSLPLATDTAQALLTAFVGSVLTIAVFALWMRTVVVGLATGQVSARVVAAYLDDAFQQRIMGTMVALVGCLITVTVLLPEGGDRAPVVSTGLAVVVVIAALIAVLLAMRDAVASLSMPNVTRTLADHVLALLAEEPWPNDPRPADGTTAEVACIVRGRELGWVQDIDYDRLLEVLPDGTTCELQVNVGEFLAVGEQVAHLDLDVDEETLGQFRDTFTLERVRSSRLDLAYAIQQLVDVAEHAMAPHSADTSTAHEALVHLRAVLHVLVRRGTASGCVAGPRGTTIVSARAWSTVDYLDEVFSRLQEVVPDGSFGREVQRTIDALSRTAEEVGDAHTVGYLQQRRADA